VLLAKAWAEALAADGGLGIGKGQPSDKNAPAPLGWQQLTIDPTSSDQWPSGDRRQR
jgi:hypothetical protein